MPEPRFEGFGNVSNGMLKMAFQQLQKISAAASQALLGGDLAAFQKWFDTTGANAHLMKVATIVKGIDEAVKSRPITFVNATGNAIDRSSGGLCGYVFLVKAGQFRAHFGSGMRIMVVPGTHGGDLKALAETMYHEIAHKVGGVTDICYPVDKCLALAAGNPADAANNAENYNRFAGEFHAG